MTLGLYFDDFNLSDSFTTPARTITESDIVLYSGLSGDYNPLHTDEEFAKTTQFGTRIAAGMLGRIVLSGLITRLGIFEGTVLANLELTSWRFTAPIFIGDTIHGALRVVDRRRTSAGDRGVVEFGIDVPNQHGEIVQTGQQRVLVAARAADSP